jgi:hypothetical protein
MKVFVYRRKVTLLHIVGIKAWSFIVITKAEVTRSSILRDIGISSPIRRDLEAESDVLFYPTLPTLSLSRSMISSSSPI